MRPLFARVWQGYLVSVATGTALWFWLGLPWGELPLLWVVVTTGFCLGRPRPR